MTGRPAPTPDVGDRCVVASEGTFTGFGSSSSLADHLGKHGVVIDNNGWGLCTVTLDDGTTVRAWNGSDLVVEDGVA